MTTQCAIECVRAACPDPDWLEKHEGFVITIVGLLGGACGIMLTYFLKSRCTKIKCCGFGCDREPVHLEPSQVEIVTN
jgi:hypothetical protein